MTHCFDHGDYDGESCAKCDHIAALFQNWKHPTEMDREELGAVVSAMSWMALDLAQHLSFLNIQFREGGRKGPDDDDADGYVRGERMAYEISHFPYHGPNLEAERNPGVAVFGKDGLEAWT